MNINPPTHPFPITATIYRILKVQGKNAVDGAYDYVVKGRTIGGVVIVAYPAECGNSGVMTFIVNRLSGGSGEED